nr:thiol reductant ABC exporter subunit CydC [Deinobacterium chartae]
MQVFLRQRGRVAGSVALGAGMILASVGLMFASGYLISRAAQHPPILHLMVVITSVRFFGVSRAALRYAERLVSHDLTFRALAGLRERAFVALTRRSPLELLSRRSGDLLGRVRSDVDTLQNAYLRMLAPAVVAGVVSALTAALLAFVSPLLAALLLALLATGGVLLPLLSERLARRWNREAAELRARYDADLLEGIQGLSDLLASGAGGAFLGRLERTSRQLEALQRRNAALGGLMGALSGLMGHLGLLAALLVLVPQVSGGSVPGALLAACALGVLASFEAVANLPAAYQFRESARVAAARLHDLERAPQALLDPPQPLPLPRDATLRLEQVSAAYGKRTVLHEVELTVRPGERIGLTGPSGSGKTTLAALLLRFLDPTSGRITLGGVDLRDLELEKARAQIAWMPQEAPLLEGTLRANLRLGNASVSDLELEELLHELRLEALLTRAGGLSGWLGEGGARLSGGERQRVALARALLRDAPIVLLDEPTAHLDPVTERAVLSAIERRLNGRSLLLITHRPAPLALASRHVRLEAGRLREFQAAMD